MVSMDVLPFLRKFARVAMPEALWRINRFSDFAHEDA